MNTIKLCQTDVYIVKMSRPTSIKIVIIKFVIIIALNVSMRFVMRQYILFANILIHRLQIVFTLPEIPLEV